MSHIRNPQGGYIQSLMILGLVGDSIQRVDDTSLAFQYMLLQNQRFLSRS